MGAKLRILVLVLVTVCLHVPAGASLRVCLCGFAAPFAPAATGCCMPGRAETPAGERRSCCERDSKAEHTRLAADSSCHGTDRCACHVVRAPERDDANTLRPALPGVERVLAAWIPGAVLVIARPARHEPVPVPRATDPPGRRRNLPLRI